MKLIFDKAGAYKTDRYTTLIVNENETKKEWEVSEEYAKDYLDAKVGRIKEEPKKEIKREEKKE
jgi:hypothetical protein